VVERFAWSSLLVGFDFDGTLAPIVTDPAAAALRPRTRALLGRVAHLYPCVVISGRTQADTAGRLSGISLREVIGNHGAERQGTRRGHLADVRRWRRQLEERLGGLPGVWVEDKALSLSIHYRRARAKRAARAEIFAAVAGLAGESVRVVGGKQVVNLVPQGAPDKGMALESARRRLGCQRALYVGDDDTDEDVFARQDARLLCVRVGVRGGSRAPYYLHGQPEIDDLLRTLLRARAGRLSRGIAG
jgi:trehalose 6-phosphate phosphatase